MAANPQCIGNCRICTVLGACPADTLVCEDCGEEIEPGEEIELEVETYERGRHGTNDPQPDELQNIDENFQKSEF